MFVHGFLPCLNPHWVTHTFVPSTLSVFHQPSSLSVIRDGCGNLPWECGLCATTQVETSVISLRKLFNRLSSRGSPQPGSLGFDHPDWRSAWKLLHVPFLLNWGFISTGGRCEMGRKESVIQTQARKPACTPRSTAAGTGNIGQGGVLQITSCFAFHQQPQF